MFVRDNRDQIRVSVRNVTPSLFNIISDQLVAYKVVLGGLREDD